MTADRPYQSQLFTVLNRSVQRAKDQAGLLWRTLKVAATWGAQLSLYPFYAVIKAGRLVGKQLGQTWRSEAFRLRDHTTVPESDAPIQIVLTALRTREIAALPAGEADCLMIALAEGTQIQGIASIVSTRRLALVTSNNQSLDILSEHQQHELRQRIIYEIASYWRAMRSRRLTPRLRRIQPRPIDRVMPIGSIQLSSTQAGSIQLGSTQLAIPASAKPSPVQIPTLWQDHSQVSRRLPHLNELPEIIQAALYYFFGSIFSGSVFSGKSQTYFRGHNTVETPQLPSVDLNAIAMDPWDLAPSVQPITRIATIAPTPIAIAIALPQAPALNSPPLTTLRSWIQSRLASKSVSLTPTTQPSQRTISNIPATDYQLHQSKSIVSPTVSNGKTARSPLSKAAETRVAHAPDWLETSATHLGYDVSWVDRLVLGLDRAIVLLEQLFLKFWTWLQVLRKTR